MRTVYTVRAREELTYHGLGVPHYNRDFKCDPKELGQLTATEIDGAIVLATSDETGDVVIELVDNRVCIVNARTIDFFKEGVKQAVVE
jgi:hypothetical protein